MFDCCGSSSSFPEVRASLSTLSMAIRASINAGDALPDAVVFESVGYNDGAHCPMPPKPVSIRSAVCAPGTRVALFGLPGAFTATCSGKHLPGFLAKADEFRQLGVTAIVCVAVNDGYVMQARCVCLSARVHVCCVLKSADTTKRLGARIKKWGTAFACSGASDDLSACVSHLLTRSAQRRRGKLCKGERACVLCVFVFIHLLRGMMDPIGDRVCATRFVELFSRNRC